jgi:hypothetical protein
LCGIDDQDPVQQLTVDTVHGLFTDRVRHQSPHRDCDHIRGRPGERGIECRGEPSIPVPDLEPAPATGVLQAVTGMTAAATTEHVERAFTLWQWRSARA